MLTSKLTEKYQATVPKKIRQFLKLQKGDRIAFDIAGENVILHKVAPFDREYLEAVSSTLNEWNSDYDEEAYRDLQTI